MSKQAMLAVWRWVYGMEQLSQLMIDYDVGVAEELRYVIKKIDLDYFTEE